MSLNGIEEEYAVNPWETKLAEEYEQKAWRGTYGERDFEIIEALERMRRKGCENNMNGKEIRLSRVKELTKNKRVLFIAASLLKELAEKIETDEEALAVAKILDVAVPKMLEIAGVKIIDDLKE